MQPSFNRDKAYVRDLSRGRDNIWVGWDDVWVGHPWRLSWGDNRSRWWIGDKVMWCCGRDLRDTAPYVVPCLS